MNQKTFRSNFEPKKPSLGFVNKPISVNIPVTNRCNYSCKFCFGKFNLLPEWVDDSRVLEIPEILSSMGTQKITLEGGEPFLFERTFDLLKEVKRHGMKSCVITNGSLVTEKMLSEIQPYLDWVGLSVDSMREDVEVELRRGTGGHIDQIRRVADWCHEKGIKLKVNTVVTRLNKHEDITELIGELAPKRYKILKLLVINGENDDCGPGLSISDDDYHRFVERHKKLEQMGIEVISEDNEDMTDTYLMLLPDGRFLRNHGGVYSLTDCSIFEDPEEAFGRSSWNPKKFSKRGGLYDY